MQIFYAPGIKGNFHALDENESRHIVRVLRMTRGEQVMLIDGNGTLYEGVLSEPDQKSAGITIVKSISNFEERSYRLHIAISPLKNTDRFEWFVEKSVEIGIDEITPLICRNTEKTGIKYERLNGIIISAMKQSLKARKPVLSQAVGFADFVSADHEGKRMIAHCNESIERKKISEICSKSENAVILIGPEGDFTPDEILLANDRGFSPVHLGKSRLRTETAGISACHSVYFINQ